MPQNHERGPASAVLVDKAARWLLEQALFDVELQPMLNGCFKRLHAAGMPLSRAHMAITILQNAGIKILTGEEVRSI